MGSRFTTRQRKPMRLKGWDYATPGLYFVTICTHERMCVMGEVDSGEMRLSAAGEIVDQCWRELPRYYPHVKVEPYVVMPNHTHAIIEIQSDRGGLGNPPLQKAHGLTEIIRGFKTLSSRQINERNDTGGAPFWQRSFYDVIIRDEKQLQAIQRYILNNPNLWEEDEENPL